MKKPVGTLDAVPSKRLFLSIIADYDLRRSICELVDNGLDEWVRRGRPSGICIGITLDKQQQTISVIDNAGGLPRDELLNVVGPGHTGSKHSDETIGIFGVGTKRAVVALGEDIKITTRHSKGGTFRIEFDDEWLTEDDNWSLPVYQVDDIQAGTTHVEISRLRVHLTAEEEENLRDHLEATYARFLSDVRIELNTTPLVPKLFDNWAYPPDYSPTKYHGPVNCEDGRTVRVEAIAGLSLESSPSAGEYGVYFYCNDRLVARALKTYDVGYMRGLAGLPHPKNSLVRVIVSLKGSADSMPWNSSKSDISTKHEVFTAIRTWLVQVVKDYTFISRTWVGNWPEEVFKYTEGSMSDVAVNDFPTATKSFLPPLPRSRPRYGEVIQKANKEIAKRKPWTKGLYEGIVAADLISKQHNLEQRNRIALIVLDSTLEIAFKDYLVNDSGTYYTDAQLLTLFKARHTVHAEVQKTITTIKPDTWKKINYYYNLRCKLVHERTSAGISDADLQDFRAVAEDVLKKLFKLKFSKA